MVAAAELVVRFTQLVYKIIVVLETELAEVFVVVQKLDVAMEVVVIIHMVVAERSQLDQDLARQVQRAEILINAVD